MPMPLEGVRVLEIGMAQFGPHTGVMLSDMGAQVIKVERVGGELTRQKACEVAPGSLVSAYFEAHNRNKKGLTVDITSEPGRKIIYRLVEESDVFLQNHRPGVLERHGYGYKAISGINPRIIYASASGFGTTGPYSSKPSFDLVAQAMGGIMCSTAEPGHPPTPVGAAIGDQGGSVLLAYGIMTALYVRERTGLGQEVSVSLLDAQILMQSWEATTYLLDGELPVKRRPGRHPQIEGIYQVFKTKDISIAVATLSEDRWPGFCRALGREDLTSDNRFCTQDARIEHTEELLDTLEEAFGEQSGRRLLKALEEADIICGPVNSFQELFKDPQVLHNEMVVELDHPVVGKLLVTGNPVKLSKTPGRPQRRAPTVGEHNEEILSRLGYSDRQIEELRTMQII